MAKSQLSPFEIAVQHANLKIEWAKKHISQIEKCVELFISRNSDLVRTEVEAKPGLDRIIVGPSEPINPALVLHTSDAVHNLNSVADYLWSGLARTVNDGLRSKVTFPRAETRENLNDRFSNGVNAAIHQAFPKAKAFVIDRIQPYKRSDDPSLIWHLNKIDNISKHRLLLLVGHLTKIDGTLSAIGGNGSRLRFHGGQFTGNSQPVSAGLITSPAKIEDEPNFSLDVVIAERDHFSGEPVLETMVNLTNSISEIVDAFKKEFA